jgi:hypothetical protein
MKFFAIISFFLFSISLSAQDKKEAPEVTIYSSVLQQGELLSFANKALRFKEVISDSRCPKGVTCVWAGEAKVLVEVFENGKFLEEKIISVDSGNIPWNFTVKNITYSITGLNLYPYPTLETKKTRPEYSLQVQVSEKI